jgi:hypothetical protein
MLTVEEAFKKFRSRLELNTREQEDTSRRHKEVREIVGNAFGVEHDFLTGSYARWTKTKPLKDVDIFFVLDRDKEGRYLDESPSEIQNDLCEILAQHYGGDNVSPGRHAVQVRFRSANAQEDDAVMSVDAVPAFATDQGYRIPSPGVGGGWTLTNPTIHKEKATAANKAFGEEWKPMVKMIKRWNETQGKPIKPSFLIEVLALEILYPRFSGGYVYELKSFFATAAERIDETWEDPAGLGPPVSEEMDAGRCANAKTALKASGRHVDSAIRLQRQGNNGGALKVWRENVFGKRFPLS